MSNENKTNNVVEDVVETENKPLTVDEFNAIFSDSMRVILSEVFNPERMGSFTSDSLEEYISGKVSKLVDLMLTNEELIDVTFGSRGFDKLLNVCNIFTPEDRTKIVQAFLTDILNIHVLSMLNAQGKILKDMMIEAQKNAEKNAEPVNAEAEDTVETTDTESGLTEGNRPKQVNLKARAVSKSKM